MLVESEFEVAAPLEQVWKHMQDVPRIAPCLPGAELIDVNGDVYKGRVTTKMGPVKLQFLGTAKIVQRDESAKRIVMDASGSEEKGKGQATMKVNVDDGRFGKWDACDGGSGYPAFRRRCPVWQGYGSGRDERDHEKFRHVHRG